MKLDNLKFQIKHTTGYMLTANQQRPYQHCPQVKSQLSGSSSSPGYSQHMAELSNSGGVQAPENFLSTKVTFWPRPSSTWVNLVYPNFAHARIIMTSLLCLLSSLFNGAGVDVVFFEVSVG